MITVINIDILVYSSLIFICLCNQLQLRLVISRLNHSKLCSIQHYVIKARIESQHWRPLWNIWNTIAILFISWICYFQICQTLQTPSGHVFGKRAFTFTGSCCIGDKCNFIVWLIMWLIQWLIRGLLVLCRHLLQLQVSIFNWCFVEFYDMLLRFSKYK